MKSGKIPPKGIMTIPDRIKFPVNFDPVALKADLDLLKDSDWINHFVTQNYDGNWDIVPLRGPAGETHPIRMAYSDPSATEFEDTPFLSQCKYFKTVLDALPFELHAVRLMSLSPGSKIKPHFDNDLSFEDGFVRLHIPIVSNPDVEFTLNQKPLKMKEGECWYLRLSETHSVYNGGETTRVHLVIDAPVTSNLRRYFESFIED